MIINEWNVKGFLKRAGMVAGAMILLLPAFSFSASSPAESPKTFSTAKKAAKALIKASEANDTAGMLQLFAPNGQALIESGDPTEDKESRARFAELAHQKMALRPDPSDPSKIFVSVGDQAWPFPVPLIQKEGRWMFDPAEGKQEVRARHIGRHELTAIEICRGYVEAQNQYAQTHLHQNVPEYAQNMVSAPGRQDGLYWETGKGELPCPVPADFAKAARHMTPGERKPYHGYYFQILTAQGPAAHGGAANYIADGAMTGGFALVAWPADYGESGIVTFIVNQNGTVCQKDLGAETDKIAPGLTQFNPDSSWTEIKTE